MEAGINIAHSEMDLLLVNMQKETITQDIEISPGGKVGENRLDFRGMMNAYNLMEEFVKAKKSDRIIAFVDVEAGEVQNGKARMTMDVYTGELDPSTVNSPAEYSPTTGLAAVQLWPTGRQIKLGVDGYCGGTADMPDGINMTDGIERRINYSTGHYKLGGGVEEIGKPKRGFWYKIHMYDNPLIGSQTLQWVPSCSCSKKLWELNIFMYKIGNESSCIWTTEQYFTSGSNVVEYGANWWLKRAAEVAYDCEYPPYSLYRLDMRYLVDNTQSQSTSYISNNCTRYRGVFVPWDDKL